MKKKEEMILEEDLVISTGDAENEEGPIEFDSPRKAKTVLVPKVQNMDDYMIKHYKSYILQELNADNITLALGRIKSAEDAIDQEKKWMKFDDDFLTIAKSNSPFSVNIKNDALNFNRGEDPVAYINTERFGITDGEIAFTALFEVRLMHTIANAGQP